MALRGQRVRHPGRGKGAHDLARLQGRFGMNLRPVGDAAQQGVELAGDAEHRIAQLLRAEAARLEHGAGLLQDLPAQAGLRIRQRGAAPVGLAGHDEPVHGLDRPALLHQRRGQPVEQFRMRGFFARAAEVVGIAGQRLAEVPEPEAVDPDARGQRIVGARDPARQSEAAAFDLRRDRGFAKRRQNARRHRLTRGEGIAAGQDGGLLEFAPGQAVGRHAQGLGHRHQRRRTAVVDAEGEGFVALQLPTQALQPLACDPLVAVVLGREADQLGRKRRFRHALALQQLARRTEDVRKVAPAGTRPAARARLGHGGVPAGGIEPPLGEPALRVGQQLGVQVLQGAQMPRAQAFQMAPLLEALRVLLLEEGRRRLGELRRREAGLDGVVVVRRHRIELVVVAARALQGLAEECLAHAVGDVVEEALPRDFGDLHAGQFPGPHAQEAGGDAQLRVGGLQFVTGDLLEDEAVVGLVGVEAAHDVIAVAPGVAALVVVGEAAAVGVADDVEPVPRHALAVMRAGEQAVDERGDGRVGIAGMGGGEGRHLLGPGRQTGQIVGGAAQQGAGVGRRRGLDARGQPRFQKGVDRMPVGNRRRRLAHRLVSPQVLRLVAPPGPVGGQRAAGADLHAVLGAPGRRIGPGNLGAAPGLRPGRAAADPGLQPAQLPGAEAVVVLGRHRLPVVMGAGRGQVQRTLFRPPRHQAGPAAVAAAPGGGGRAQVQPAFDLVRILAVAGQALLLQQRPHPADKQRLGVRRAQRRGRQQQEPRGAAGHAGITPAPRVHFRGMQRQRLRAAPPGFPQQPCRPGTRIRRACSAGRSAGAGGRTPAARGRRDR